MSKFARPVKVEGTYLYPKHTHALITKGLLDLNPTLSSLQTSVRRLIFDIAQRRNNPTDRRPCQNDSTVKTKTSN